MQSKNNELSETELIFFDGGRKIAQSAIDKGLNNTTLFAAIKELYSTIDAFNDSILNLAKDKGVSVACKKGCEWCCHQAVYANSYEFHFLSDYLKDNFSFKEIQELKKKTKNKFDKTSKLSNEENLVFKYPCPLLHDGACLAYQARPVACRIYLSRSLESCLTFYQNPENETKFPDLLEFPLKAGRLMNEGFMSALLQEEIDTVEYRIEEGLTIML